MKSTTLLKKSTPMPINYITQTYKKTMWSLEQGGLPIRLLQVEDPYLLKDYKKNRSIMLNK